jgi:choline dehydrogenase-like flavoprotein
MASDLPMLVPGDRSVEVQRTSLSLDAVGRYLCSTWDEAMGNGGAPFDVVVVGAGMYGGHLAARAWRLGAQRGLRVLVLEAGPFLVSQHVQNLPDMGFDVPAPLDPARDPGVPRALVWGLPWRGNVPFPGLAYCAGGKSLYWGGWCPQLTDADLALWPAAAADGLREHYGKAEEALGVVPSADFITGALYEELRRAFGIAAAATAHADGVAEAPLAVQGGQPASGLFSFDKYSSMTLLAQAIRDDVSAAGADDRRRRLFLVPNAHVIGLDYDGERVTSLEVWDGAQVRTLAIAPQAAVALAASAIESTRLALAAFPTPLMGGNLMAHLRTDFGVRIRRDAFQPLPKHLTTGALLVRGSTSTGRFHVQVTASANRDLGSDGLLFRMVPDLDLLDAQLANDDPDWIALTLRGVAETFGDRGAPDHDPGRRWIELVADADEWQRRRAWVNLAVAPAELQLWHDMEQAMLDLAAHVAGAPANVEYLYDNGWQPEPFPLDRPFPAWRQGLGETYHEAGTLWMGDDPASSITDLDGRFHHVANAFAADQAAFPTVGSVNPVLTGIALARRLAEHLVARG